MADIKKYKGQIITILVIIGVLMLMVAVGFTLGILSEDPDGLEKSLIDAKSEHWLENLPSFWEPIFGGIESDYVAGLIGIGLSIGLITLIFYGITKFKQKS